METPSEAQPAEPAAIAAALDRMGLIGPGETPRFRPLDGGVSSEIWLVELPGRRFCLKRALPRLKVAQLWEAPVIRNHYEAAWFRAAGAICPEAVPRLLGEDEAAGLFAMEYLDPAEYPVWKPLLRDGHADPASAASVGERLARIHAATAGDAQIARAIHDGRQLLCAAHRAVSDCRKPCASRSRRTARHSGGDDRPDPPHAGPWRCQPEKHPDRAARAGVPRRGMRMVRRSGVRPCLLPQPSAAEVPVEPGGRGRLSRVLRPARASPISAASAGSRRRRSKRAPRACCRDCCWRGSTANRRSNMSRSKPTRAGCGTSRGRCCVTRSRLCRRVRVVWAESGEGCERDADCRRAGPAGLGFARAADRRSRAASDGRRGRAGDRTGRRLDRLAARRSSCATAAPALGGP